MFLYLLFLFYLIKKLYRTARLSNNWGAFVGFLCFLFANFTEDINHFIEPGLVFMLIFNKYYESKLVKRKRIKLKEISPVEELIPSEDS